MRKSIVLPPFVKGGWEGFDRASEVDFMLLKVPWYATKYVLTG